MNVVATLHRRARSRFDVATEMDKVVGDISGIGVKGQDVLVGVFLRPSKQYVEKPDGTLHTKTGTDEPIELFIGGTGKELVEDIYQGKVVRILKMGPQAFCPDTFPSLLDRTAKDGSLIKGEWHGMALPKVGDWVYLRANDGQQVSIKGANSKNTEMFEGVEKLPSNGGWPCRVVAFNDIIGTVDDPWVIV